MANLRDLLYTGAGSLSVVSLTEFVVENRTASQNNGGACCLWTVPAGTSYIRFEIWGGGGSGGGTCCCMQGHPGGSGAYAIKTLTADQITPGTQYTICAAGTSCFSNTNNGCVGYDSYVTGPSLSNFCAKGGGNGCTNCNAWQGNCHQCRQNWCRCGAFGGDICSWGACGASRITMYCFNQGQQWAPVASGTVSGPVFDAGGCTCTGIFNIGMCAPVHPGGGGFSALSYGGACRCSWYGAAGAVSVTFG